MKSMSRNKNSSVEQNIVLCRQQIAENPMPLSLSAKNSTHTQLSSKISSWYIAMLYYVLRTAENRYSILNNYYLYSGFVVQVTKPPKRSVRVLARDIYISCSKSNSIIWSRRATTGNVRKLRPHLFDHVSLF
jgi:hypothetical protein